MVRYYKCSQTNIGSSWAFPKTNFGDTKFSSLFKRETYRSGHIKNVCFSVARTTFSSSFVNIAI